MSIMNNEYVIKSYQEQQRFCDIADKVLQLFSDNQFNTYDSDCVLTLVQDTIKEATRRLPCGSPLIFGRSINSWAKFMKPEDLKQCSPKTSKTKSKKTLANK